MKLIDLTILILNLSSIVDSGQHDGISIGEVEGHIRSGDLLDWLAARFRGSIDLSMHNASGNEERKRSLIEALQNLLNAYGGDERRKWGIVNNGICLLLSWVNELVQQRTFSDDDVPAADRFVSLDHNSATYQAADAALEQLEDAVRGSNELFANPEDRIAVAIEVRGIRALIASASVRLAAIQQASDGVIRWLAKEAASGVVRALAGAAAIALAALIYSVL